VILFGGNATSPAQVRALTSGLQRASGRAALIATDQEGGTFHTLPWAAPHEGQPAQRDSDHRRSRGPRVLEAHPRHARDDHQLVGGWTDVDGYELPGEEGADLARFYNEHMRRDAEALPAIASKSKITVFADIHYQPKFAFAALEAGCASDVDMEIDGARCLARRSDRMPVHRNVQVDARTACAVDPPGPERLPQSVAGEGAGPRGSQSPAHAKRVPCRVTGTRPARVVIAPGHEPDAEAAHYRVMRLLARQGERVAALGGHLEVAAVFRDETVTLLVEPVRPRPVDEFGK